MMEGKIRVRDLLYTKGQLEKCIVCLERLSGVMFNHSDDLQKIFEASKVEKVSSFDVNGSANYLRDYLKLIDTAINSAEVDWPLK